jgi:hypothetical protein
LAVPCSVEPTYNTAPGQTLPVIVPVASGRTLASMRWGLVPWWARDEKIGYKLINARAETVSTKSGFRTALRERRCLVPTNWFYEWKGKKGAKIPHVIQRSRAEYSLTRSASSPVSAEPGQANLEGIFYFLWCSTDVCGRRYIWQKGKELHLMAFAEPTPDVTQCALTLRTPKPARYLLKKVRVVHILRDQQ